MPTPEWTVVDFIHRGPWWRNRGILILNLFLFLPLLTASVNGYDSSLVNGLQILPEWQDYFHHPHGKGLGLINSAQNIGSLIGLPFTPFSSDILGRRATLFIGAIVMLGGVATQFAANGIDMLIGARVLIGFGLTFALNASPLLITELAYPTQRGKITSLYNAIWYLGSILSAWACFGAYDGAHGSMWSWRAPTIVQAFVPILQLCGIWFVPESPRWLISKGRESEASRILARFHASGGDERDPLVMFEMAQIRHALRLEQEFSKNKLWSLFSTTGNRKRMRIIIAIAIFSQWSGNGLVSYYINLVLDGVGITTTSTKAALNGGLMVWNLVCAVTGALLVDKLGRRTIFIISNAGMLLVFAMWTLTTALFNTTNNKAAAVATVPLIFLFYLFYDLAYTPLLIAYTLEILPFNIRAKGFAVMNFTVAVTIAFNQFVNPWALGAMGWKYYLVYCGWLILEVVFIVTYIVETKGLTLEETAILFDGEEPQLDIVQTGGEAATMSMGRGLISMQDNVRKDPAEEHKETTRPISSAPSSSSARPLIHRHEV
ncbi:hypothetical protein JAAARDRAFT_57164 [Jaapia argillacea MUCL 33604]|uniref:Major facilitator superfamily (MFS) profile domain-containing protein n=1 Tax=Jaapia argillacea MUCL 33604 TaxID=933084 RepID=A0A067PWP3_9AGAM|nr:hypothetical protein JAAARDRAFT_57164 [Jaapia argillacea MUCL 33604]